MEIVVSVIQVSYKELTIATMEWPVCINTALHASYMTMNSKTN